MIHDMNSTQKDDASFSVTEKRKAKALSQLMEELETGMYCQESFSEEEAKKLLKYYFPWQEHLVPTFMIHIKKKKQFINGE